MPIKDKTPISICYRCGEKIYGVCDYRRTRRVRYDEKGIQKENQEVKEKD